MKKFLLLYAGIMISVIGLSTIDTNDKKDEDEVVRKTRLKLASLKRFVNRIDLNDKNLSFNKSILIHYINKLKPDSIEEADILKSIEDNDQYIVLIKVWADYLKYIKNIDKTSMYLARKLSSKEKYVRAIVNASDLTEKDIDAFLEFDDTSKCWDVIKNIMEVI